MYFSGNLIHKKKQYKEMGRLTFTRRRIQHQTVVITERKKKKKTKVEKHSHIVKIPYIYIAIDTI